MNINVEAARIRYIPQFESDKAYIKKSPIYVENKELAFHEFIQSSLEDIQAGKIINGLHCLVEYTRKLRMDAPDLLNKFSSSFPYRPILEIFTSNFNNQEIVAYSATVFALFSLTDDFPISLFQNQEIISSYFLIMKSNQSFIPYLKYIGLDFLARVAFDNQPIINFLFSDGLFHYILNLKPYKSSITCIKLIFSSFPENTNFSSEIFININKCLNKFIFEASLHSQTTAETIDLVRYFLKHYTSSLDSSLIPLIFEKYSSSKDSSIAISTIKLAKAYKMESELFFKLIIDQLTYAVGCPKESINKDYKTGIYICKILIKNSEKLIPIAPPALSRFLLAFARLEMPFSFEKLLFQCSLKYYDFIGQFQPSSTSLICKYLSDDETRISCLTLLNQILSSNLSSQKRNEFNLILNSNIDDIECLLESNDPMIFQLASNIINYLQPK